MTSLPKGWREVALDSEIEILSGGTPKTSVKEYWSGSIPWLSVADFNDENRWVYSAEKKISGLGAENSATSLLRKGDLIISARGTVGALAQVAVPMAFNQSCYGIRAREGVSDDFLFYLIKSKIPGIKRNVHGAVFDTITRDTFSQISVTLPPRDEQLQIAAILSSLDKKIDFFQRQNETLEQIAQTIFNDWFVKPAAGSVLPAGWKAGTLGEVLEVKGGTTPSTSNPEYWGGEIFWSTPKDLSGNRNCYLLETATKITEKGLAHIGSGLLPVGTLLLSSRAPIGYQVFTAVPMAINQGYIAINSRGDWSNYFTFLWLKANMQLIRAAANGSTFMEISKGSFRGIEVPLPDKDVLGKFTGVVSPLFEKMLFNARSIAALADLRDALLPRLMSGKIRPWAKEQN